MSKRGGWLWMLPRPEHVRSVLGLYVVISFPAFVGLAYLIRGREDAEGLASLLVGLAGSVLGWDFGSRGVDRAEHAAEQAEEKWQQARLQAIRAEEQASRVSEAGRAVDEMAAEYEALLAALRDRPDLGGEIQELIEDLRNPQPPT